MKVYVIFKTSRNEVKPVRAFEDKAEAEETIERWMEWQEETSNPVLYEIRTFTEDND